MLELNFRLYYGTIYGRRADHSPVAATHPAIQWFDYCSNYALFGSTSDWIEAIDYDGVGLLWEPESKTCILTHLQRTPRYDDLTATPYLYHWVLLSIDDFLELSGYWKDVTAQIFQRATSQSAPESLKTLTDYGPPPPVGNLPLDSDKRLLAPLRIRTRSLASSLGHNVDALYEVFTGRDQALLQLLSSLFDGNGPVAITGLEKSSRTERELIALALGAGLAPALRMMCTFATEVIGTRDCPAHFKILSTDDQRYRITGQRLFNWERGQFEGKANRPNPYAERIVGVFKAGRTDFIAFLEKWHPRTEALVRYHQDPAIAFEQWQRWLTLQDSIDQGQANNSLLVELLTTDESISKAESVEWIFFYIDQVINNGFVTTSSHVETLPQQEISRALKLFAAFTVHTNLIHDRLIARSRQGFGLRIYRWVVAICSAAEQSSLDRQKWRALLSQILVAYHSYLLREPSKEALLALDLVEDSKGTIDDLSYWNSILETQVSLAAKLSYDESNVITIIKLMATKLGEEAILAAVEREHLGWMRTLSAEMQSILLAACGKGDTQFGLWPVLNSTIKATQKEKEQLFSCLTKLASVRESVSLFNDELTVIELKEQANQGNTAAYEQLEQLLFYPQALQFKPKVRIHILHWALSKAYGVEDNRSYQDRCITIAESLDREIEHRWIPFLSGLQTPIGIWSKFLEELLPDPNTRVHRSFEVLKAYRGSDDRAQLDAIIANVATHVRQTAGWRLPPALRRQLTLWIAQHENEVPFQVHDWWLDMVFANMDHREMRDTLIDEIMAILSDEYPIGMKDFFWKLGDRLFALEEPELQSLRAELSTRHADIAELIGNVITVRTIIGSSNFKDFAKQLHEVSVFIDQLRAVYEGKDLIDFKGLSTVMAGVIAGNLEESELEVFVQDCAKVVEQVDSLMDSYRKYDQANSNWLPIGKRSNRKTDGIRPPRSPLGLLTWMSAVTQQDRDDSKS